MADRAPPPPNNRLGTSRLTRAATSATGIRRNLFQNQPNRRPTSTEMSRPPTLSNAQNNSSSNGGGGGNNNNNNNNGANNAGISHNNIGNHNHHHHYLYHQNHNHNHNHNQPPPLTTSSSTNSAETLRLDQDVLSETSEIVIRDQNGEFEIEDPPTPPLDDPDDDAALDDAQENERERQKLAAAVRHHQINHTRMPVHHEEILDVLKASMRAKVAALAEDNWMYEAEEPPRVH
ncbi:hypothetical protein F5Y08DRAFT_336583 [Xylaria arbuscula]|nr:hypothetical protein F5Y08DRAFT_336583 [Xylaria arbuscula]